MIELILLRHAQPDWEPDARAVDDPCLTPLGEAQAVRVAEALADERLDAIYVSPLLRARQTAEPVARRLAMDPQTQDWLEEIRLPSLAGEPADKVHAFLSHARQRELASWWDGVPGGESFRHFHERVSGGVVELLEQSARARLHAQGAYRIWQVPPEPRKVLVVAHSGTVAVLLGHLLGVEPVPWEWERFRIGWAGIARVRTVGIAGGAIWALSSFNTRDHLKGLSDPES